MRALLLAPVILLALACTPQAAAPIAAPAPEATSAPSNAGWSAATEAAFVQACSADGGSSEATCLCMARVAQEHWTDADLIGLDLDSTDAKAVMVVAVLRCTDGD